MNSGTDLNGASVLVTGGAGFIGSHLVDALLERGARVRVLDDLSNGRDGEPRACRGPDRVRRGRTSGIAQACRRACEGVTVVFHQAALGSVPRSMKDPCDRASPSTSSGTANVFAAARDAGVRRVVYASSSSVYGDSTRLPKREGEEGQPLSPYALSKAMDEELAEVFRALLRDGARSACGTSTCTARARIPDGPYAAVIPRFFKAYLSGAAPVIYGDGAQSRDFTFVADAVAANLLAATAAVVGLRKGVQRRRRKPDVGQRPRGGGARGRRRRARAAARAAARGRRRFTRRPTCPVPGRELGYAPRVGLSEGLRTVAGSLSPARGCRGAMSDVAIRVSDLGKEYRIGGEGREVQDPARVARIVRAGARCAALRGGRSRRGADEPDLGAAGRDLRRPPRRGRRPHRAQRRGQEHAAEDPLADHRADARAWPRSTAASARCSRSAPGSIRS